MASVAWGEVPAGNRLDWNAGGGILNAGVVGEYFANTDLGGEPEFTRREPRIAFDWGEELTPGGSVSPAYRRVSRNGFSVRWTGRLFSRFTETYRFVVEADDGARLFLRPEGEEKWTPVIEGWKSPGLHVGEFPIEAGRTYEMRLEYRQSGGPAKVHLSWEGASFPRETVEAVTSLGMDSPKRPALMANAYEGSWYVIPSPRREEKLKRCAEGWPAEDFQFIVHYSGNHHVPGTYLLRFAGRADVSVQGKGEFLSVDRTTNFGNELKSSSNGDGYDQATNTTEALFVASPESTGVTFHFLNTDRDGEFGADGEPERDGLTEIWVQKPVHPFADTPHEAGEWFSRAVKSLWERFTTTRWTDINAAKLKDPDDHTTSTCLAPWGDGEGLKHALKVLFANETGSDLWVQVPHHVIGGETEGKNDEYVRNMAKLLRYGCDARGRPYDSFQKNPAFPGLNPNLNVYVEFSNEVPWNHAGQFPQSGWLTQRAEWEVANGTETGKIINFDGQATDPGLRATRYVGLRVRRISEIFREVWGDENMPLTSREPRIRPVMMGQYANPRIPLHTLHFLDAYFNNATGQHVADPRPVNYYLWSYGAASYYGSDNPYGLLQDFHWPNADAESPALADGQASVAPDNVPGWKFEGLAGIYRNAARKRIAPGETYTAGDKVEAVYEFFGKGKETVDVIDLAENKRVMRRKLQDGRRPAGQFVFFVVEDRRFPLLLEPGRGYRFENASEIAVASEGIVGEKGDARVDLGFAYDAPEGSQGIFLAGQSTATLDLDLPGEDVYAIRYQLAQIRDQRGVKPDGKGFEDTLPNPLDMFLVRGDGVEERITMASRDSIEPGTGPNAHGDFARSTVSYQVWGSAPFRASGKVKIRFAGTAASPENVVFVDDIRLASVGAFGKSSIPSSGRATGETAVAEWFDAKRKQYFYGQAYGLHAGIYEGGWYPGGDWERTPIQLYFSMHGEPIRGIERDIQRFYDTLGARVQCDYTLNLTVPTYDYHVATNYQRVKAWDDVQAEPATEADFGLPPGSLPVEKALWGVATDKTTGAIGKRGGLLSWNIIAPQSGDYFFQITLAHPADFALFLDGNEVVLEGNDSTTATGLAKGLTKGLHAVRLQSRGDRPVDVLGLDWGRLESAPSKVDAGESQRARLPDAKLTLRGSISDPDSKPVARWSVQRQPSGANVVIERPDQAETSVVLDAPGEYLFALAAIDGGNPEVRAFTSVIVEPDGENILVNSDFSEPLAESVDSWVNSNTWTPGWLNVREHGRWRHDAESGVVESLADGWGFCIAQIVHDQGRCRGMQQLAVWAKSESIVGETPRVYVFGANETPFRLALGERGTHRGPMRLDSVEAVGERLLEADIGATPGGDWQTFRFPVDFGTGFEYVIVVVQTGGGKLLLDEVQLTGAVAP